MFKLGLFSLIVPFLFSCDVPEQANLNNRMRILYLSQTFLCREYPTSGVVQIQNQVSSFSCSAQKGNGFRLACSFATPIDFEPGNNNKLKVSSKIFNYLSYNDFVTEGMNFGSQYSRSTEWASQSSFTDFVTYDTLNRATVLSTSANTTKVYFTSWDERGRPGIGYADFGACQVPLSFGFIDSEKRLRLIFDFPKTYGGVGCSAFAAITPQSIEDSYYDPANLLYKVTKSGPAITESYAIQTRGRACIDMFTN